MATRVASRALLIVVGLGAVDQLAGMRLTLLGLVALVALVTLFGLVVVVALAGVARRAVHPVVDAQRPAQPVELRAIDAEDLRGPAHAAVRLLQRLDDR